MPRCLQTKASFYRQLHTILSPSLSLLPTTGRPVVVVIIHTVFIGESGRERVLKREQGAGARTVRIAGQNVNENRSEGKLTKY